MNLLIYIYWIVASAVLTLSLRKNGFYPTRRVFHPTVCFYFRKIRKWREKVTGQISSSRSSVIRVQIKSGITRTYNELCTVHPLTHSVYSTLYIFSVLHVCFLHSCPPILSLNDREYEGNLTVICFTVNSMKPS